MDHYTTPQLSIPPRVRVSRNTYLTGDVSTTPTAGPSRLSPKNTYLSAAGALDEGEGEDMDATPRISAKARLPSPSTATPSMQLNLTEDTPAGRLRAILARVPNTSASQLLHEPAPHMSSALTSDFDDPPPQWNTTAASIARESLKDLFSNARRDDTLEKRGRRRNSIDASEVEEIPRVDKVAQERAKNKGKRKSLSDEELEKSSTSVLRAGSSHAINIEALRNLLTNYANGHSSADTQFEQGSASDMSNGAADASHDAATFLRQLNSSTASPSPPDATSTPMRSLQFPSQYQNDSNLLDGDSEMQRALGALDSFEGNSVQQGRPPSFPPARQKTSILGGRSLASLTHTKSLSEVLGNGSSCTAKEVYRRASVDSDSISSHTGLSLSASNFLAHEKDPPQSNRSSAEAPDTPSRDYYRHHRASHSQTGSPLPEPSLSRRGSVTSLRSMDSPSSSRPTSSIGSNADYRDRMRDSEREPNRERERAWNKPKHALSRQSSHNSLTHRRPDSAQSLFTPDKLPPSRAASPAGSARSSVSKLGEHKVVHERERNWNSPQPKWNHRRSTSPLPSSSVPSPRPSPSHSRIRMQSTPGMPPRSAGAGSSLIVNGSGHGLSHSPSSPRSVSPSPSSRLQPASALSMLHHSPRHTRASSPVPPSSRTTPKINGKGSATPAFGLQSNWQFPRRTAPLPRLEIDDNSPERPAGSASASSSRKDTSVNGHDHSSPPSRIPVPSPGKVKINEVGTGFRKGHKRTVTEFSEANGAIPPRTKMEAESEPETEPEAEPTSKARVRWESSEHADTDMILESDVDDHDSFLSVKAIVISPGEDSDSFIPTTPSFLPAESVDEVPERQEISNTPAIDPLSSTAPISPSPPLTSSVFPLTTPPRRPFSTPKIEFPTPSPPKNLPDLPIPSSEDEGVNDDDHTPVLDRGPGLDFSMKTPRPPGAWLATPAPARHTCPAPPEHAPAPQATEKSRSRSRSNSLPQPAAGPDAQAQPAQEITDVRTSGPSALTRAHTLPSRTPAPPGAWLSTPGSTRKSLMKVRFDVTSDSAPSEVGDSTISPPPPLSAAQVNGGERAVPPLPAAEVSVSEPSFEGVDESSPVQYNMPAEAKKAPETPKTPAHQLSSRRRPKRSPSIRLVDEYGQECVDTPKEVSRSMRIPGGTLMTPRNKSTVRMLDAMGRQVEEPSEQNDSEDTVTEMSMPGSEALARVKKAVAELHDGIDEVNKSEDARLDDKRISDLHDVSRSAREARTRITKSLKEAQKNQAKLRDNYDRESMQSWRLLPTILPSRSLWSPGLFWSLCAVQFVLFLFIYRVALQQAKHQFLTTYYDPFYAELYLQPVKPQTFHDPGLFASLLRRPIQSSNTDAWTLLVVFWHGLLDTFARWQCLLWDSLGPNNDELVQAVGSWPPT